MDIHKKLQDLLDARQWTRYRLAKECGLSEATIANIFKRGNVPSLVTLEQICSGFKITLSQFFCEENMVELSPELKNLFEKWVYLTSDQKNAIINIINVFNKENE